jgi:outer membrane protein assembly factor BamB
VWSSPAVADGVVYVGSSGQNVYAINAGTGAWLWTTATGGAIDSSPTVANGVVYIGSGDHDLYALNAATGAVVWSATTGDAVGLCCVDVDGAARDQAGGRGRFRWFGRAR